MVNFFNKLPVAVGSVLLFSSYVSSQTLSTSIADGSSVVVSDAFFPVPTPTSVNGNLTASSTISSTVVTSSPPRGFPTDLPGLIHIITQELLDSLLDPQSKDVVDGILKSTIAIFLESFPAVDDLMKAFIRGFSPEQLAAFAEHFTTEFDAFNSSPKGSESFLKIAELTKYIDNSKAEANLAAALGPLQEAVLAKVTKLATENPSLAGVLGKFSVSIQNLVGKITAIIESGVVPTGTSITSSVSPTSVPTTLPKLVDIITKELLDSLLNPQSKDVVDEILKSTIAIFLESFPAVEDLISAFFGDFSPEQLADFAKHFTAAFDAFNSSPKGSEFFSNIAELTKYIDNSKAEANLAAALGPLQEAVLAKVTKLATENPSLAGVLSKFSISLQNLIAKITAIIESGVISTVSSTITSTESSSVPTTSAPATGIPTTLPQLVDIIVKELLNSLLDPQSKDVVDGILKSTIAIFLESFPAVEDLISAFFGDFSPEQLADFAEHFTSAFDAFNSSPKGAEFFSKIAELTKYIDNSKAEANLAAALGPLQEAVLAKVTKLATENPSLAGVLSKFSVSLQNLIAKIKSVIESGAIPSISSTIVPTNSSSGASSLIAPTTIITTSTTKTLVFGATETVTITKCIKCIESVVPTYTTITTASGDKTITVTEPCEVTVTVDDCTTSYKGGVTVTVTEPINPSTKPGKKPVESTTKVTVISDKTVTLTVPCEECKTTFTSALTTPESTVYITSSTSVPSLSAKVPAPSSSIPSSFETILTKTETKTQSSVAVIEPSSSTPSGDSGLEQVNGASSSYYGIESLIIPVLSTFTILVMFF